jgi:DNA-binding response OmpR family regulator
VSQAADARVLLVEDDPELMEFVRFMLEQEKYQVITANNGEDGLNKARAERPDLVLLDVLLPKIHGFEVCERLRQDPATCLIPIIMVTSLTAIKDRLTGIKLGADEYISKPFEPVELLARVENLILRTRQNVAANPLTGLAGGVILEQEIKRRLHDGVDFSLGWGDATHLAESSACSARSCAARWWSSATAATWPSTSAATTSPTSAAPPAPR